MENAIFIDHLSLTIGRSDIMFNSGCQEGLKYHSPTNHDCISWPDSDMALSLSRRRQPILDSTLTLQAGLGSVASVLLTFHASNSGFISKDLVLVA